MGSAVKKVTKPIKKIVKSPLAPIAAGIFGPAALAAMGPGTFGAGAALGGMGTRAALSNLIAQAVQGDGIDPKSAALSGITASLGQMGKTASGNLTGSEMLPYKDVMTDTVIRPSLGEQAKNLGIKAAGKIGNMLVPDFEKANTLGNIGKNIGRGAAAMTLNPGTAMVMAELNQESIDKYNASLMGSGMKDRGARRNAIFQIYMNTGAYEADEVNAMLDKYGYAQGGIIGLKEGGSYMDKLRDAMLGRTMSMEELLSRNALATSMADVPEVETDSKTTVEEVEDEDGNIKFVLKTNEDFGEDLTSGLGSMVEGAQMAFGRPFGEMEPTPMMRFKKGGKVIKIMPDKIIWKGKAKDYPGIHEVIKQNRKKKTGPGVQKKAKGGIMDKNLLNTGMDKDMRGGGFIPEGTKEKADDVPARLSKNEFVMTADAVKAAGGGSVNQGAKRMYQLMNNLQGKA